ncbi:I78 family peptidase inhibitor [Psychromarinibacter sp. C21-152]|uniref:I78 family peptidase inhibitor n=1 Tax=Psychromarinibacter sediminicola TaxID=3033385 RepID=A0AAE3T7S5_9RHOB|nr:I78 family peptidase inhibitor [Psychromarinibacter sediminicola]MDF0599334.1 I78 family peptidase inhibitor [Psychromarinibacter sediminicola]
MTRPIFLTLAAALALAAPSARAQDAGPETPEAVPELSGSEDTCGAAGFQGLVGQPRAVVDALELAQPMRIVPHDGMVTMDFRPDRINFALTEDARVEAVTCG